MNFKFSSQTTLWLILISIMLVRLLFLGAYPLADTTEARYGEMGRLMLETGDWITPQFEKDVPFWESLRFPSGSRQPVLKFSAFMNSAPGCPLFFWVLSLLQWCSALDSIGQEKIRPWSPA